MYSKSNLKARLNRLANLNLVAHRGRGYFKSHRYFLNNSAYRTPANANLPGYTFEKFDEAMRSGKKVKISQQFPNGASYELNIGLAGGLLRLGWVEAIDESYLRRPIAPTFLQDFDPYKPFLITIKNDKNPGDEDEYYITTGKYAEEIEWMDDLYRFLAGFYDLSSKLSPAMPAP